MKIPPSTLLVIMMKLNFCKIPRLILPIHEVETICDPHDHPRQLPNRDNAEMPSDLQGQITTGIEQMVEDFALLPHTTPKSWCSVNLVLALSAGPQLLCILLFLIPLKSVDSGLEENRVFMYGISTLYEAFFIIPWIETFNYSLPDANIPIKNRTLAYFSAVITGVLFKAVVAEGWWGHNGETLFPVPFSMVLSMTMALVVSYLVLFILSKESHRQVFSLCFGLWCRIIIALLVGLGFIASFISCRDSGQWWLQPLLSLGFEVLRLLLKIMVISPNAMKLNAKRFVFLAFIVDMIFASMQTTTVFYVSGKGSLVSMIVTNIFSLVWRYYGGVDRLQIAGPIAWFQLKSLAVARDAEERHEPSETVQTYLDAQGGHIIPALMLTSVKKVHEVGKDISKAGKDISKVQRNYEHDHYSSWMDDTNVNADSDDSFVSVDLEDGNLEEKNLDVGDGESSIAEDGDDNEDTDAINETDWTQRLMYHVVDALGSDVLETIVFIHSQMRIWSMRNLPMRDHLNDTFELSDEQWSLGLKYGFIFIAVKIIAVSILTFLYFRSLEKYLPEGMQVTLNSMVTYIFRNNFWFLFLWLTAIGALSCIIDIKHFGADFTMKFEWISCPEGEMAWPKCQ